MERLDKFIVSQTNYSRSDVKKLIKKKLVKVNNIVVNKNDIKINPIDNKIMINNELINYQEYVYLILNKPKGYVSARVDKRDKTVLNLVPEKYKMRNLFPAGRLDKDTTGLMIITDDGMFAHNILSPNKHISKKYMVIIDQEITSEMVNSFYNGVKLIDGICKMAILEKIDNNKGIVTLTEGRYHQIKRMFACFNATVLELKRISMGDLVLPKDLPEGEVRELTKEEVLLIRK